ncbi:MAG: radical SAM protein [Planctomycetes bacterium]|nr:radical SAM protein [Planctomycetota bacterium]
MRSRVLLLQLPIPSLAPGVHGGNAALAAGAMALRARRLGLDRSFDLEILPARLVNECGDQALVEEILAREPMLVGLSCYLWNVERSLDLARRLRARRPGLRVVLGGPEISRDNRWVLEAEAIDFAAFGEGEQTFAELLLALEAGREPAGIPGLFVRGGDPVSVPPRAPLTALDLVTSAYVEGLLDLREQDGLALETIRGCVFTCGFCYYPKSYDKLYYLSEDAIRTSLRHARELGRREVFLLDPTLNQRRDFAAFLGLLAEENRDRFFEFHAELRAEGIKEDQARLMGAANFREVEVGLQSTDEQAQELMDRRNNLRAFERGLRLLREQGIAVKTDLIVGLPGDDVDSIRRSFHWVAERELYDTIQVFQLAVLPGTNFRLNAAGLGLIHQARPPYYVLRTPALDLEAILGLMDEAEELFDTSFDPLPEIALEVPAGGRCASSATLDLDADRAPTLPERCASAFQLRLRCRDPWASLDRARALVAELVAREPHLGLQIVLETDGEFPLDVIDGLATAADRDLYVDRVQAFLPGAQKASSRIAVLMPAAARAVLDQDWRLALEDLAELIEPCS